MFASETEGFGLVINEAACFGLPIVCNYYLGVEDLVEFDKNGYYYQKRRECCKVLA